MALMITLCVIGFSLSMERLDKKAGQSTKLFGVLLMVVFLVCDALTSNGEKRIFNSYKEISSLQMMLVMALFALIYSSVSTILDTGIGPMFAFLMQNPSCMTHIAALSTFAVSGQLFTFYIIRIYGPVIFSIMMTVRQIFSMVCSAILFGHQMTLLSCVCA